MIRITMTAAAMSLILAAIRVPEPQLVQYANDFHEKIGQQKRNNVYWFR